MIGSDFRVSRLGWRRASAAAFFSGVLLFAARAAIAAPFVPTDPDQILEKLPPRTGPDWEAIAALRAEREQRAACRECTSDIAARIAERYLALFRAQGDPRLVAYAERELEPWGADADPPIAVALERAEIAQLLHRFDAARTELERVLARTPRDSQGWLTLAAIDLTNGSATGIPLMNVPPGLAFWGAGVTTAAPTEPPQ